MNAYKFTACIVWLFAILILVCALKNNYGEGYFNAAIYFFFGLCVWFAPKILEIPEEPQDEDDQQ